MQKLVYVLLAASLLLFCVNGCAKNTEEKTVQSVDIKEKICEVPYTAEVMGYEAVAKLDTDGTGTITVNGQPHNFKYTISDQTPTTAKITVSDTGYSEIDGKSANIIVDGDYVRVSYGALSFKLKPADE